MRSTCWRATALAPIGDLRYLADAKLDALTTPIAKAQIAAALAMVGDRTRAERVLRRRACGHRAAAASPDLIGREDYGSTLRDAAALVALASEGGAPRATVQAAVQRVEAARANLRPTSTQEDAWLLLAASAHGQGRRQDIARRRRRHDDARRSTAPFAPAT